jgi:hypothetical protein
VTSANCVSDSIPYELQGRLDAILAEIVFKLNLYAHQDDVNVDDDTLIEETQTSVPTSFETVEKSFEVISKTIRGQVDIKSNQDQDRSSQPDHTNAGMNHRQSVRLKRKVSKLTGNPNQNQNQN